MNKLTLCLILSGLITSCSKTADVISNFHITGTLVCKKSCESEVVKLSFIDSGLDYVGSERRVTFYEQELSLNKEYDHTIEYFWGYEEGFLKKERSFFFNIYIEADSCRTIDQSVYLDDLINENGTYIVNLNDYQLNCN